MEKQARICNECCEHVDNVYMFREQCIKNINLFKSYVSKLQSSNEVGNELSVAICGLGEEYITANIVVKSEEIEEEVSAVDSSVFENVKVEYELLDNSLENCDIGLVKMEMPLNADEQNFIGMSFFF